jgi:hypothetical protein
MLRKTIDRIMATKQELKKLLHEAIDQCTVHVPVDGMIGGGYDQCCWCGCEQGYRDKDAHYEDCLYYRIYKII